MVGKDKKGQRTKGNVKPSSSGRSAELLGNGSGFIGFSGLPEGAYVPVLNIGSNFLSEEAELSVPGDLRLTLRKMGKKDVTTKIKALQEFISLCEQLPLESVKTVLPFWPRIYAKLALDDDRRVREHAQKAHLHFTSQLGRNIAPHLKELMGVWSTSQCDTYAPASTVAAQSLKSCFPDHKLTEALAFCHNEIMDYIRDSLFKVEDVTEEQKERILVGSLAGYSLMLQQIQKKDLESEKNFNRHKLFWEDPALYKVVTKNSNALVKQSWFRLLSTFVQLWPQLAKESASRLLTCLFSFLDDTDTIVQTSLWECVLKCFLIIEDTASYVNVSSTLSPRLLNLIKNGFFGNASTIGPLVLPLVQQLRRNIKQKESFDEQLLANFRHGFMSRTVAYSPMEAAAYCAAFAQSLDFIIHAIQDEQHIEKLFDKQVMSQLKSVIQGQANYIILCPLMHHLATTLYDWSDSVQDISQLFWNKIEAWIRSSLINAEPSIMEQIGCVLMTLLDPNYKPDGLRKPPSRRIRFTDAETVQETPSVVHYEIPANLKPKIVALTIRVCHDALRQCEEAPRPASIQLLSSLLSREEVTDAFLMSENVQPREIISRFIQPLLNEFHDSTSASLLFTVLNAVEPDQRLQLLEEIIGDESTCVALATTALEKFTDKETVVEWLRGVQVKNLLSRAAHQLCDFNGEDTLAFWSLVRAAFSVKKSRHSHDLLLPESHIDAVLSVWTESLNVDSIIESAVLNEWTDPLLSLWKSSAHSIQSLASNAKFLDAVFWTLCTRVDLQLEAYEDLINIWDISASLDVSTRCRTALVIMKNEMLKVGVETNLAERFVQLFKRISLLVEDVDLSVFLILYPSGAEWKKLRSESSAVHLMAKELLSGTYLSTNFSGNLKSIALNNWSLLIKVAYIISAVACQIRVKEFLDVIDLLANLYYAMAAAGLVRNLYAKRAGDCQLKGLDELTEKLKVNVETICAEQSSKERADLHERVRDLSQSDCLIWSCALRKLQSIHPIPMKINEDEVTDVAVCQLSDKMRNSVAQLQMVILQSLNEGAGWRESCKLLSSIGSLLCSLRGDADSSTLERVVSTVQVLKDWQRQNNEEFLFAADLKNNTLPHGTCLTIVEMIRLLSTVVELYPGQLSNELWDFVLCSMTSWCSTLDDSWSEATIVQSHDFLLLTFTVSLCRLVQSCSRLVVDVVQKKVDASALPQDMVVEWNDVFAEAAFSTIVPLFARFSQRWNATNSPILDFVMEAIVSTLMHVPKQHIHQSLEELSPLLLSRQPAVQFGAYRLIIKLLPDLAVNEATLMNKEATEDQEKAEERVPPYPLFNILDETSLDGLDAVRVGDLHWIEAYSDECRVFIGYCLTWKLVLSLCGCSSSELRYQYAAYLGNSELISQLMANLFRIIPHTAHLQVDLDQEFQPDVAITSETLQDLAVQVYTSALRYLPAVVRRWYNNADKKTALLVEKFTSKCVSPVLCTSDLQHVTSSSDNMTVRVRLSAREAIATYKLNEEASMELVVQLPSNYPLGNITVEGGKKVGVTTSQWRNWMLQLTTFLMHQNGSILDGLTLWKRNVDKRFEGIEECYICYYVLHGSNYQLPKLSCRTCKKKFHAACLYKWFSTSNNSTCPLCRNLF